MIKSSLIKLTCIGHSGSNCSVFYFIWQLVLDLSDTLSLCRHERRGLCMVKSAPCITRPENENQTRLFILNYFLEKMFFRYVNIT